ncbi:hypothetical protein J6590_068760 [Homalodisca vitripennis]|nr:hypothetical protein J6590_068760 [Homalodisca vitripennis]
MFTNFTNDVETVRVSQQISTLYRLLSDTLNVRPITYPKALKTTSSCQLRSERKLEQDHNIRPEVSVLSPPLPDHHVLLLFVLKVAPAIQQEVPKLIFSPVFNLPWCV